MTKLAMSAMILAAGRGQRMRPLTDTTPKPLLRVQGKALIRYHVDALLDGGFDGLVINTAWLGEQMPAYFEFPGTGVVSGAREPRLWFSNEGQDFGKALETAGGVSRALPMLTACFWVIAGDIFAPRFDFSLQAFERFKTGTQLAHLWLVPNPPHNLKGDFGLTREGLATNTPDPGAPSYTFSAIGLYRATLFQAPFCQIPAGNPQGVALALAPVLRAAMAQGLVSAELYSGEWHDIGTPERLAALNSHQDR